MSEADAAEPVPGWMARLGSFFQSTAGRISALTLFIVGTVTGTYVQALVERLNPEFFDPSVESLVDTEYFDGNFTEIRTRLDKLAEDSGRAGGRLVEEVSELFAQREQHLIELRARVVRLAERSRAAKDRALDGVSHDADFELALGESVTVGARGNTLGLLQIYDQLASSVLVSVNGSRRRLSAGDVVQFDAGETQCAVSYMGGDYDHRLGRFDLVCRPPEQVATQ